MQRGSNTIPAWTWIFAVVVVCAGGLGAWAHRFEISSDDAVSYLDLADAWRRGDVAAAVNGHWPPLYSWLLAAGMALCDPAPKWEFALLKFVNLAGLLAALAAFCALARESLSILARQAPEPAAPRWCWTMCAACLFVWAGLLWIGVRCDTPDLWGMAFILGAEAALLRTLHAGMKTGPAALFGVLLGCAYLAKYAMMPVAIVALGVLVFHAWRAHAGARAPLVALVAFACTAGPYVALLSAHYHHTTISESGRLSYALIVNPPRDVIPSTLWQGGPDGFGRPVHPPRVIHADPPVYEFAAPIGGTYPPWLDPAYWMEGLRVRVDPARQATVLFSNAGFYLRSFLAVLIAAILALSVAGRATWRGFPAALPLLLPGAAGLGLYVLLTHLGDADLPWQPSMRYVAPFVVMLSLAAVVALRPRVATPRVWAAIALVLAGSTAARVAAQMRGDVADARALQGRNAYMEVATAVRGLGIGDGDGVAILGDEPFHEGWARLARGRIIVQLRDTERFWELTGEERARVFEAMEAAGARVVVGELNRRIPVEARGGWRRIKAGPWAFVYARAVSTGFSPVPTP